MKEKAADSDKFVLQSKIDCELVISSKLKDLKAKYYELLDEALTDIESQFENLEDINFLFRFTNVSISFK